MHDRKKKLLLTWLIHLSVLALALLSCACPGFSLELASGTIIKPNSTSAGYYVLNNTAYMDGLTVNTTHAILSNVNEYNWTVVVRSSAGKVSSTLCSATSTCTIPQTSTVKNIALTTQMSTLTGITYTSACVQIDTSIMQWFFNQSSNTSIKYSYCNFTAPSGYVNMTNSTSLANGQVRCDMQFNETGTWYARIYAEDEYGTNSQTGLYAFSVQASCGAGQPSGGDVGTPGGPGGPATIIQTQNVTVPAEPCSDGFYFDTATQRCLPLEPTILPFEETLLNPLFPGAPEPLNMINPFMIFLIALILLPLTAKKKIRIRRKKR